MVGAKGKEMKSGKVWGETARIFSAAGVEAHRIHVKNGGFCSRHSHQSKFNWFYVESGHLRIQQWTKEGLFDQTDLKAGDYMTISPGIDHRFIGVEETVAFEIYWAEMRTDDIERKDIGGLIPNP